MRYFEKRKNEKERRKKWVQERQRIISLREELNSLGEIPKDSVSAFKYAVNFFNIVSSFQDEGLIKNAPEEILKEQEALNKHIENAGRCEYGINRTKCGEKVTLDNTYWGNIFGLYTFSGEDWIKNESVYRGFSKQWLKNPKGYEENPFSRKVVVDFQVIPFFKSHYEKMLSICEKMIA